jgi:CHAD domain-containing protein
MSDAPMHDAAISASSVVRHVLACEVGSLVRHDPDVRADLGGESVHQMRVATRRLRSELRVFAPILKTDETGQLDHELRWLGGNLGSVRDLDVMIELVENVAAVDSVANSIRFLKRQRSRRMKKLAEAVETGRYRRLLRSLVRAVATPPFTVDAARSARSAFEPGLRRVVAQFADAVTGAMERPEPAHLHAVRIAAKTVRYNLDVGEYFLSRDLSDVAHSFVAVQDLLGAAGDVFMAVEFVTTLPRAVAEQLLNRRAELLVDWLQGAERARELGTALVAGFSGREPTVAGRGD